MGIGMRIGINGTADINDLGRTIAAADPGRGGRVRLVLDGADLRLRRAHRRRGHRRSGPRIELGTAVVPTFPRHPMMLAGSP